MAFTADSTSKNLKAMGSIAVRTNNGLHARKYHHGQVIKASGILPGTYRGLGKVLLVQISY